MQCLHPCSQDTPIVIKDWGAIVQTDIHQADETLGSLRTVVKAELAHNGCQGYTRASQGHSVFGKGLQIKLKTS
jgi:hypothetical protein